jgi:hypothetical protein
MLTSYITASKDTPSRSGLYANQLPGVTLNLLDDLTKDEQEDWEEFWDDIYARSIVNFVGDVQGKLADKFNIDLTLLAKETSTFKDDLNTNSGIAGVKLEYDLPKYGVLHVVSIEVFADAAQVNTPDNKITFYDTDENGRVLYEKETDLTEGLNTINIDQDFHVDKLFIAFDTSEFSIRETKNKYYDNCHYYSYSDTSCLFPCYGHSKGGVTHVNGGGINVIYNAHCSISKFVEDNINTFKEAFWYRIGLELIRERIFSDRFNRWTTMQPEDAESKQAAYVAEVELKLNNSIRSLRLNEDPVCFSCKSTVFASYQTP